MWEAFPLFFFAVNVKNIFNLRPLPKQQCFGSASSKQLFHLPGGLNFPLQSTKSVILCIKDKEKFVIILFKGIVSVVFMLGMVVWSKLKIEVTHYCRRLKRQWCFLFYHIRTQKGGFVVVISRNFIMPTELEITILKNVAKFRSDKTLYVAQRILF